MNPGGFKKIEKKISEGLGISDKVVKNVVENFLDCPRDLSISRVVHTSDILYH